jgi:hypothetical protein
MGESINRRLALVLHQYDSDYMAVLDRLDGRIDILARSKGRKYQQSMRGAYIQYYVEQQRGKLIAHTIDIIYMPFHLAQVDILFLHHVLELIYTFLPLGTLADDLFMLIYLLYTYHSHMQYSAYKKFFLVRILDLLGLHPSRERFHGPEFHTIVATPIDRLLQDHIDLQTQEYIQAWLHDCIKTHPVIDSLKTFHFLDDVRA